MVWEWQTPHGWVGYGVEISTVLEDAHEDHLKYIDMCIASVPIRMWLQGDRKHHHCPQPHTCCGTTAARASRSMDGSMWNYRGTYPAIYCMYSASCTVLYSSARSMGS